MLMALRYQCQPTCCVYVSLEVGLLLRLSIWYVICYFHMSTYFVLVEAESQQTRDGWVEVGGQQTMDGWVEVIFLCTVGEQTCDGRFEAIGP